MEQFQDLPLDIQQFVSYEKDLTEKKSKNYKKQVKNNKMKNDLIDPEMKKQRHIIRRTNEKAKLQRQIKQLGLNQQELRKFLDEKKQYKKKVKQNLFKALEDGQMIFIDLVYEKKMNEKQNKSLAIQIELITKTIRHLPNPPGVHLCSVGGKAQAQLQKMKYHFWTLKSHKEDVNEVAKLYKKKVIYLSPDADLPLTQVDQDTAYVIGGLIDRTVIKNASRDRARELDIQSRYLPIKQMMVNRSCLNLDHVVLILSKFKQCGNWKEAFEFGAPKRWNKNANRKKQDKKAQNDQQHQKEVQLKQSQEKEQKQDQQKYEQNEEFIKIQGNQKDYSKDG